MAPETLQVRIGIATGSVVVGQTGAGDASVPKLAVGETPNLAARLQSLAGPDEIVISASTRSLIGATFNLCDFGEHMLKGIVESVRAWKVVSLAKTEGRFEAARGHTLTPLVGREEEIALLTHRWRLAKEGEGQMVLLGAEPGIGKSRLTQVLREHVTQEPHDRLQYQCSPYHASSALYPFIAQIERSANFESSDGPETKFSKLEQLLGQPSSGDSSTVGLYASLLSIHASDRYPSLGVTPQKQQEMTLQALSDRAITLASKQPLLIIFEDVHWVDPTSQEAIGLLASRIVAHRILLVLTYRPEYQPPWLGLSQVTRVTLTRLARKETVTLVERITGGKKLPTEVVDLIVAKTDGVPLFIEEFTKTVLESNLLKLTEHGYQLTGSLSDIAIPSTLRDSLMARLDRLPLVREMAQIGACIGREFSHSLLDEISSITGSALTEALQNLVNSELVHRVGNPPAAQYTFKHALIQDAAYASLINTKKRELHARIAQVLESGAPDIQKGEPELIARHYTEAGFSENAIPLWLKAGELGISRAAHREALVHLNQGLALLATQRPSSARADMELTFQMSLGSVYNVLHGWSAPEVKAAYERAKELVSEISDPTRGFNTLMGLYYYYNVAGEITASTPFIGEAVAMAEAGRVSDQLVVARQGLGQNLLFRGRFGESAAAFGESLAQYDKDKHAYLSNVWGGDFFTYDQGFLAFCYWNLGRAGAAKEAIRKCVEHAESFRDPIVHTIGYLMAAAASVLLRDWESVMKFASTAEAIAEAGGMQFQQVFCRIYRGCAMICIGPAAEGHELLKANVEAASASGFGWLNPWLRSHLALSHALRAEYRIGMDILQRARGNAQSMGDTWALGLLDFTEARILEMQGDVDGACGVLRRAIDHAREQPSKGVELRAATSLANLLKQQGRVKDARAILAPLYGFFTDGFDTPDLIEAKAVLDSL